MAKIDSAWGIDIGQCALKAVRCAPSGDDPNKIVADAFDYIEYPKILTQPEADPVELVREALQLFLSRNDLQGTKVAVSVSGQSGLARFIKHLSGKESVRGTLTGAHASSKIVIFLLLF